MTVNLYNENDELITLIEKNDWIMGNSAVWDFEFSNNYFIIRKKDHVISLQIDATKYPIEITGQLWKKKQCFLIKPSSLKSKGLSEVTFSNCRFASLNIDTNTSTLYLMPIMPIQIH